jgi:GNAT superfamily N-acetyltransferase
MIRPLRQTDYAVTKQLFSEAFVTSEIPNFIEAWASRSPNASFGYWVYGTLVGAAIASDKKLNYIFIHSEFRSGGTGTQLLNAVLQVCPNLHLTPVDTPYVLQWYEKHGFRLSKQQGAYTVYVKHTHNLRSCR